MDAVTAFGFVIGMLLLGCSLGATRMLLGVYGKNLRAHRFYEKQGFVRIGERQFLVGVTLHDDFVYALDL